MIKIIITIMILIIGTSSGINVGFNSKNSFGTFSDGISVSGNTAISGHYMFGNDMLAENTIAGIDDNKGCFSETIKTTTFASHTPETTISKIVENDGSGEAYSITRACMNGYFVEIDSGLWTDSRIGHAELHYNLVDNLNPRIRTTSDAMWHFENVQAITELKSGPAGVICHSELQASSLP